jgi:hypothetical protein
MTTKLVKLVIFALAILFTLQCHLAWADDSVPKNAYGWVVLETLGPNPDPIPSKPFIVNVVQTKGMAQVKFQQVVSEGTSDKPQEKLLDTLNISLKKGYILDGAACEIGGVPDPEIMFQVKKSFTKKTVTPVSPAWRTNRQTGKVEPISIKPDVTLCRNRFFGI